MAEALFDLEQVLSSKKEKLTPQEVNILMSCKSKAVRDSTAGAIVGASTAWAATRKLSKPFRINFSAGAAAFVGLWIFRKSLYASADQILTLDGSVLQRELANVMVTKYQNDPSLTKLMSKHFYSERIFDDSTSNAPKLRWRYRNFFSENAAHGHRAHDDYSDYKAQGDSNNDSQGDPKNVNDSRSTNLETKHTFIKAGQDIMTELDPFDCLFGNGCSEEEIHNPNTPAKPSGAHNRAHRRSHRRRRMRNHEDLSNSEQAAV